MRDPRVRRRMASTPPAVTALLVLSLASLSIPRLASAQTAAEATTDDEEARARFRQGLVFARGGNCSAALAELEASYALVPRPNTLFNMAQCQERLHRYDLAIQQYEQYLEIAPADADDRDTVLASLESLRSLLGTIHIEVNVRADVWLGERIVGEAPGDVLVPAGQHALELRASGYLPERVEVTLAAQQGIEITVELRTADTHIENVYVDSSTHVTTNVTVERPPVPLAVFVSAVSLTALAGIGGATAGIVALLTDAEIAAMDPRLPRDGSVPRDAALAADILFVSAGVFAVSTVVLAFLTDFGGEPERATASLGWYAVPALSDTHVGLTVGGNL